MADEIESVERLSLSEIKKLRVAELKEKLSHLNLPVSGLKADLIARLHSYYESKALQEALRAKQEAEGNLMLGVSSENAPATGIAQQLEITDENTSMHEMPQQHPHEMENKVFGSLTGDHPNVAIATDQATFNQGHFTAQVRPENSTLPFAIGNSFSVEIATAEVTEVGGEKESMPMEQHQSDVDNSCIVVDVDEKQPELLEERPGEVLMEKQEGEFVKPHDDQVSTEDNRFGGQSSEVIQTITEQVVSGEIQSKPSETGQEKPVEADQAMMAFPEQHLSEEKLQRSEEVEFTEGEIGMMATDEQKNAEHHEGEKDSDFVEDDEILPNIQQESAVPFTDSGVTESVSVSTNNVKVDEMEHEASHSEEVEQSQHSANESSKAVPELKPEDTLQPKILQELVDKNAEDITQSSGPSSGISQQPTDMKVFEPPSLPPQVPSAQMPSLSPPSHIAATSLSQLPSESSSYIAFGKEIESNQEPGHIQYEAADNTTPIDTPTLPEASIPTDSTTPSDATILLHSTTSPDTTTPLITITTSDTILSSDTMMHPDTTTHPGTTLPSDVTTPPETTIASDTTVHPGITLPLDITTPSETTLPSDTTTHPDMNLPSDTTTHLGTTTHPGTTLPSDAITPSETNVAPRPKETSPAPPEEDAIIEAKKKARSLIEMQERRLKGISQHGSKGDDSGYDVDHYEQEGIPSAESRQEKKKKKKKRRKKRNFEPAKVASGLPVDDEGIEVEYVPETLDFNDPVYAQFARIFETFKLSEKAETTKKDEVKDKQAEKTVEAPKNDDDNEMDTDSEEEEAEKKEEEVGEKVEKLSKKKWKLKNRMSVAELKQTVHRPDVVEMHDVTAPDPKLLVYLKACRNTVPVPRHWCFKRKFLQGKRGIIKPPFQLPDFIQKTGIMEMREALQEKEDAKNMKAKMREKIRPKMGKIDIDYQKLHDAFFKWQTKPKMSIHGDLYYEGKEFETKLKEKKPGDLSEDLRTALGMPTGQGSNLVPPPWLIAMQRYGPPPSYPNLKIPGLNAPIPEGASFGYHAGGWGKPPVDEHGRPLYGDVFGLQQTDLTNLDDEQVDSTLWGELESESEESEESEEESEEEAPDQSGLVTPAETGLVTPSGLTSIPAGMETPDMIELRKRKNIEDAMESGSEQPTLYTVLPEKRVGVGGMMMGTAHVYDLATAAPTGTRKTPGGLSEGVEVALDPSELELDPAAMQARYDEQLREQQSTQKEDFSDMVAEHAARQQKKRKKTTESGKAAKKYKEFKF